MSLKNTMIVCMAILAALLAGLFFGGRTMERIITSRYETVLASMQQRDETRESFIAAQATEIDVYRQMLTFGGTASFYGDRENGKITANGERFNKFALTAASNMFPFNSEWRVTNLENRKSVIVRINDTGGFAKYGRAIDLSEAAARELGMDRSGLARVIMTPKIGKGD